MNSNGCCVAWLVGRGATPGPVWAADTFPCSPFNPPPASSAEDVGDPLWTATVSLLLSFFRCSILWALAAFTSLDSQLCLLNSQSLGSPWGLRSQCCNPEASQVNSRITVLCCLMSAVLKTPVSCVLCSFVALPCAVQRGDACPCYPLAFTSGGSPWFCFAEVHVNM